MSYEIPWAPIPVTNSNRTKQHFCDNIHVLCMNSYQSEIAKKVKDYVNVEYGHYSNKAKNIETLKDCFQMKQELSQLECQISKAFKNLTDTDINARRKLAQLNIAQSKNDEIESHTNELILEHYKTGTEIMATMDIITDLEIQLANQRNERIRLDNIYKMQNDTIKQTEIQCKKEKEKIEKEMKTINQEITDLSTWIVRSPFGDDYIGTINWYETINNLEKLKNYVSGRINIFIKDWKQWNTKQCKNYLKCIVFDQCNENKEKYYQWIDRTCNDITGNDLSSINDITLRMSGIDNGNDRAKILLTIKSDIGSKNNVNDINVGKHNNNNNNDKNEPDKTMGIVNKCILCYENQVNMMFRECKHICICQNCFGNVWQQAAQNPNTCPQCGKDCTGVDKVYIGGFQ